MNDPLNFKSSSFWGRSAVRIVFLCRIAATVIVDAAKFNENYHLSTEHLNRSKISREDAFNVQDIIALAI